MGWFKFSMDVETEPCACNGGEIVLHLDRVMLERNISLNELSERVGISNVNLSKIKNNHVTAIRFSTLAALCEVLQCEVGDLIEFVPKK